jgi:diadenosine tetraphosphate (Ap4A) HIT family hydrolase
MHNAKERQLSAFTKSSQLNYKDREPILPPILPPRLDTLAQLPPNANFKLKTRAKNKYLTQRQAIPLISLKSPLEKYYRNSFYCVNTLVQVKDKLHSKYCNTRVCIVCNRIRTAKFINAYKPTIQTWIKPHFVTLTIPNVDENILSDTISHMIKSCSDIVRNLNEKKKLKVLGIRKIEITYNAITNQYHPHIHLIVNHSGDLFIQMWLKKYPTANIKAQDCREADLNSLMELFKYSTKMIADKNEEERVNYSALDAIMRSLKNKRIIQPFGGLKVISEDIPSEIEESALGVPYYDIMEWLWNKEDWQSKNGELLTGHKPND